jgi:glycosyltransferase involved in cell wall biosynthesis
LFRRAYDLFLAVSTYTAQELIWAGAPANRVVTIGNPVDSAGFSLPVLRHDAKEALGVRSSMHVVGAACRFVEEKNLLLFIEVAAIIAAIRQDVRFCLVGCGVEESQLRRRVEDLGLTDVVLFTGVRSDMPLVMKAFDVYLFTSRREAFGRTLLESLAAETPVVAALPDAGGARDLVTRSPGILSVGDRDPLRLAGLVLRLLDDPSESAELGRAGRLWVTENYDAARWAVTLCNLYRRLCPALP